MDDRRTHTLTDEQMEDLMKKVEVFVSDYVEEKLEKHTEKIEFYARWVIGLFGTGILGFIFSWGQFTIQMSQVQALASKNAATLENSVLTVKDKDNLNLQIQNLQASLDEIKIKLNQKLP